MLYQDDDFLLATEINQFVRELFNDIGEKLQFSSEKESGIILFKFLGVVKDYNRVDIIQIPDYVEMSYNNFNAHLFKSHGWDKASSLVPARLVILTEITVFAFFFILEKYF